MNAIILDIFTDNTGTWVQTDRTPSLLIDDDDTQQFLNRICVTAVKDPQTSVVETFTKVRLIPVDDDTFSDVDDQPMLLDSRNEQYYIVKAL